MAPFFGIEKLLFICYTKRMPTTLTWSSTHKPLNQDAVAASTNCVCIADGVTPLNTTQGDNKAMLTHVFTHALTNAIVKNIIDPHNIRNDFTDCLMQAQLMVQTEGIQSTLTFATWDKESVSIACLGDSPAYIGFKNDTVEKVADPMFKGAGTKILEQVIKRAEAGKSWKKSYKKAKADLLKNRQNRNTVNGAWIADSMTPATLISQHIHIETFSRNDIDFIVLLTDGAEVFHDPFKLVTLEDLLNIDNAHDLDKLYAQAAELEKKDEKRSKYPRFSFMDDATYAKVEF